MRTTIDIDRQLLDEVKTITGSKTYSATVAAALRELIRECRRDKSLYRGDPQSPESGSPSAGSKPDS